MRLQPALLTVGWVLLGSASRLWAQSAPVLILDPIATFQGFGCSPARLTPAPSGRLYVTDPWGGTLVVLDSAGTVVSRLTPAMTTQPLAVAELPTGELALSDAARGAVDIYDGSLVYRRSLGVGAGEFGLPSDLAVYASGNRVYVADTASHRVGVYALSGARLFVIGNEGTGPGQFRHPTAIAVRPGSPEIYVADQSNGRIQVFDTNGGYKRSLGTRGALPGQFVRLQGIAVERSGNVCAADAFQNLIQVLDGASGACLAEVGTMGLAPGQGLLQPMGIYLDSGRARLLVASHNTQAIEVYDVSAVLPITEVRDWTLFDH